ncbi:transcription repressor NadR [Effusibacillus dendaii]|uniref:Transcriptional regulator n=1 Tax=Effusibacillus dendaii TaxID=2743772 RepID=A0A7I8DAF1_9BACL|nr:transcription repressor NadR [Effusibacillus dendaii]BCJ86342.1 transcriptional regulator [Effusibacillus dendaii]
MDRRQQLLEILKASKDPIAGADLAERLDVTRQTIVQDIAFLRRDGFSIISTTQGYILERTPKTRHREILKIIHTSEQLPRELEILVAHHVMVEDVFIEHPVYGRIRGSLDIATLKDVKEFLQKRSESGIPLFSEVTGGLHYHTLAADDPESIQAAKEALRAEGYACWLV